jgi:hypothetical protein
MTHSSYFEQFVESVLNSKTIDEDKFAQLRTPLLNDPFTAWGLLYVSSLLLQESIKTGDKAKVLHANLLVMPYDHIRQEIQAEKEKAARLKPIPTPKEKYAQRNKQSLDKLKEILGVEPDLAQAEEWKRIIGPQTTFIQTFGRNLSVKILEGLFSLTNPNFSIPISQNVIDTLTQLERNCEDFLKLETHLEVLKKGKPRFLRKPEIDQVGIKACQTSMDKMKRTNPSILLREAFVTAANAAITSREEQPHRQRTEATRSDSELIEAWKKIHEAAKKMAPFTGRELITQKGNQPVRNSVSAAAQTTEEHDLSSQVTPSGSLLSDADFDALRRKTLG